MFEETLGEIGYWAIIVGFIAGCFYNDLIRFIGYAVGSLILIIWVAREFFTLPYFDNGGYLASGIVVLLASYLGKLRSEGRLK
jgi:hypothetical protein